MQTRSVHGPCGNMAYEDERVTAPTRHVGVRPRPGRRAYRRRRVVLVRDGDGIAAFHVVHADACAWRGGR